MRFTKAMIDLAKEIRRRVPSDQKPSVKMANPELFDELITIFESSSDAVLRALIKELFELAGDPWPSVLTRTTDAHQQSVRTYRGQQEFIDKPAELPKEKPRKPKRIYRGQVVEA